ncbi:MAG TPA: hypothetical protein VGB32_06005 [Candidatus Bathyarchaeia archaeon]
MDQVLVLGPRVDEARAELCRSGRRCGFCRVYPGHGEVCEERGRAVHSRSKPCRVYDQVTPEELAEVKERKKAYFQRPEVKEKQKAYSQRPEVKEKQKAYNQKQRRVLELLRTADPDLYEQLTKEAQK